MPPEKVVKARDDRRSVELRAYAIRFDNSIIDVRVVDLSYDGCAVEANEQLIPGELLKLSVLERGFVRARVRWYKGRRAGLLFEPGRFEHEYQERRAPRLEVAGQVSLRRSSKTSFPVRVFDLTRFGCRCEFVERPDVKERMWVKFSQLEALEAQVCWLAGSSLGLQFQHPIHPAVFEMLLDRLAS